MIFHKNRLPADDSHEISCFIIFEKVAKGDLGIRRIFSLVDMITKPKFSNCPNIFKIGLFR